jgi:hypothetical protein
MEAIGKASILKKIYSVKISKILKMIWRLCALNISLQLKSKLIYSENILIQINIQF